MQKNWFYYTLTFYYAQEKITVLTFKNKKRTADTYTRTVLLLPKSTQHWHYCFLLICTQIVPYPIKTSFCSSVRFSELLSWKNCDNVTPKAIHIFSSVISDGRFSCAMILPSDDWEILDSCDNLYLLISHFSHKDVILSAIYFSICK